MCGIFAIFSSSFNENDLRKLLIQCSTTLRHRGPDWSGYKVLPPLDNEVDTKQHIHGIAHERLAIIDPESGSQPLISPDGNIIVAANGEIYNYKELYDELEADAKKNGQIPYQPLTGSDCEVLIPLYMKYGSSLMIPNKLRGMFSFILYDRLKQKYFIVRDHMGITPLYIGYGKLDGSIFIGSEMKSLHEYCNQLQQFPPGFIYTNASVQVDTDDEEEDEKIVVAATFNHNYNDKKFHRWYKPSWAPHMKPGVSIPTEPLQLDVLRHAFERSVCRRMMSDVPWGVLLSGGLDSSLVAAVCSRNMNRRSNAFPTLHSFTIGLEGSPDIIAAQRVAEYLKTKHHSYTYTIQEGSDAVREVIRILETYDVTTIRASIPMYLMARKIKAMGIKMVLSGEGADEVFGGYLYFHKCPNSQEFMDETIDKLQRLHMYDCLRANKAMSAWGVEPRVPFLDIDFLNVAMNMNPLEKMIHKGHHIPVDEVRIEKWCLRKAFDTPDDPYLPSDILWRQKEQFSDGVGYGWIDHLKEIAEQEVTDHMLLNASNLFPYNTPTSKEAYRYRQIFEEIYPGDACMKTVPGGKTIACSTERAMLWDISFQNNADPSGRSAIGVHDDAYIATTASTTNGSTEEEPPLKKVKA